MRYVADLHLHSKYSRAVSKDMTIPTMAKWGKIKGIDLFSSSDFTHPAWFAHLKEDLVEDRTGLYTSKTLNDPSVKFILGTEISCIYSQGGKTRRIHLLVYAPDLATVEKINSTLDKRGNLRADGRPILGMSAKELAGIVFDINPNCFIIPAHAWTPWFSLYGSNSGFDTVEECFGEYEKQIFAVETGLSSDPVMNWRLSHLDSRAIVSFSDAHSPAKMGREATIVEGELSYNGLVRALRNPSGHPGEATTSIGSRKLDPASTSRTNDLKRDSIASLQNDTGIVGTIEFFPEEGKYHYNGHRACGVVQHPKETKEKGETCPICGKRVTVGVMQRVEEVADRSEEEIELVKENGWLKSKKFDRPGFRRLVPLAEIVAEAVGVKSVASPKVQAHFDSLINNLGNEIDILLHASKEDIARVSSERIAEGVEKVRAEDIVIEPGFDGLYGMVKIWPETVRVRKFDPPKEKKEKAPRIKVSESQLPLI